MIRSRSPLHVIARHIYLDNELSYPRHRVSCACVKTLATTSLSKKNFSVLQGRSRSTKSGFDEFFSCVLDARIGSTSGGRLGEQIQAFSGPCIRNQLHAVDSSLMKDRPRFAHAMSSDQPTFADPLSSHWQRPLTLAQREMSNQPSRPCVLSSVQTLGRA